MGIDAWVDAWVDTWVDAWVNTAESLVFLRCGVGETVLMLVWEGDQEGGNSMMILHCQLSVCTSRGNLPGSVTKMASIL